ncbi:MAG: hypothetical protein Q9160_001324 [Pyrenula sp. 1 TL-2023]
MVAFTSIPDAESKQAIKALAMRDLRLLNAPSGARAENWLDWASRRVSFIEDAKGRELAEALEKGMQGRIKEQN